MSEFKVLRADDKATNSFELIGDVARIQHTSVHPKIAPKETKMRIALTWEFDFKEVTRAELIDLATRHLVIQMRTGFKADDAPKAEEWDNHLFSVRKYLDKERRKPKDRVKEAMKALEALSEEQKMAILESLMSSETDESEE